MCFYPIFKNRKYVGIGIDHKSIIPTILTVAGLMTALGIIGVKCQGCKTYAQDTLVKPEIIETFDSLHSPFEKAIRSMRDSMIDMNNGTNKRIDYVTEMLKMILPNGEALYDSAKNRVDNVGKFEGE